MARAARGTVRARARNRHRRPPRGPDPHIDRDEVVTSSISIGTPDRGRLLGGAELRASPAIAVRGNDHHFGTDEFVVALLRATTQVQSTIVGTPPLFVGDLSLRSGGRFSPHRSHRAGRDADVGFYATDLADRPVPLIGFVGFRQSGLSHERPDLKFDDRRTWALVEALLHDPVVRLQYIFIFYELRNRLLEYAHAHASAETFERAETVLFADNVHRNHMHVRIYCAEDDRPRCEDERPHHTWAFPGGRRQYPHVESEPAATPARARVRVHARAARSRTATATRVRSTQRLHTRATTARRTR